MTITKDNGEDTEQRIEEIEGSRIEEVDEICSEDDNVDENIESELDNVMGEIEKENFKPKVNLRFRNANFVHVWKLNSTNTKCLCEKEVTAPTEKDLENRKVSSYYIVSRCGCAYHTACITDYVNRIGNGNSDMINCPLCQTKYEPITNTNRDTGVYVDA